MSFFLAAALLFVALCGRDFWAPDEPRFAQVAQEMLESGDWTVPHFNGVPLALLPPLTYWGSAAASLPFGRVNELSARLPIVLFALLALAATALLPEQGGLWSAAVLSTSNRFLLQATRLQADMVMVGCLTWALLALYRAYVSERRRRAWLVSAYVAIALAVLAKGPLGALLPGAIVGLFLLWERDLRALGRLGVAWGVPLVAAIVVPWYVAACSAGGAAFCDELVLKQNFGMFFDTWSHEAPVYYYLFHLPVIFLPWTLVLPPALRRLELDRETRFLLVWIAFTFLFFSASDAKQAKYLLPILPPLSILVGRWLVRTDASGALRATAITVAVALLAGGLAARTVVPARFPHIPTQVTWVALPGLVLAVASALLAARPRLAAGLLVGCVGSTALAARFLLVPALEIYKSPRTLAAAATALGAPLGIYGISWLQTGGLVFYSGHALPLLESEQAFAKFMAAPERRLAYVPREAPHDGYFVVAESPFREGTLLVSNRTEEER